MRNLDLFGTSIQPNPYLSSEEQFLQISAFHNQITRGSENYIPITKCILLSIYQNNLDLLKYFLQTTAPEKIAISAFVLEANNIEALQILYDWGKRIYPIYSKEISSETYQWCYNHIPKKWLAWEPKVIGKIMPIALIKKLKGDNFSKEKIIGAAASTNDLRRYRSVVRILKNKGEIDYEAYILDLPEKDQSWGPAIVFGAINILKSLKGDIVHAPGINFYPQVDKSKAQDVYNYLQTLNMTNLPYYLEYYHWMIYGETGGFVDPQIDNYVGNKVFPLISQYVQNTRDPKLMERWLNFAPNHAFYPNLYLYPQLSDVFYNNITQMDQGVEEDTHEYFLQNLYSPKLYLASFDDMNAYYLIKWVPTWETLRDHMSQIIQKFKDEIEENGYSEEDVNVDLYVPQFLGPRRYWDSQKIDLTKYFS